MKSAIAKIIEIGYRKSLTFCLAIFTMQAVAFAGAQRMDSHTHDLVINKLETALPVLRGQRSEVELRIRLADLYADRARMRALEENEKNCQNCLNSKQDRETAIAYYLKALNGKTSEMDSRWVLQVSHLYALNGQLGEARLVLNKIINSSKKYSAAVNGEAHFVLGDLYYRDGKFTQAQKHFEKALKMPISNSMHARYRIAWCHLNAGRLKEAKRDLKKLLQDTSLTDQSLRKDYARDYVTFVARDKVTNESIEEVLQMSAPDQRANQLFYLGQECDRLGNRKGALLVWSLYSQMPNNDLDEKLDVIIRSAQTVWDEGHTKESLSIYQRFFDTQEKRGCKSKEYCDEVNSRARKFVHTWIQKDKAEPSANLLSALTIYTKFSSDDVEMLNWAGHVSKHLKNHLMAADFYGKTATAAHKAMGKKNSSNLTDEQLKKIFEGSLLAEIESAEDSQDGSLRMKSYQHYLTLNPNGEKRDEVLYQIAHVKYENKEYLNAGKEFSILVLNNNALSNQMKIQAADLALECFDKSKSFKDLIESATRFGEKIPVRQNAYLGIARKAVVNLALAEVSDKKSARPDRALEIIKTAPLQGANDDEKIQILRNTILLAEQAKNLDEVAQASQKLLQVKNLSTNNRLLAKEKLLWVYESRFEFSPAVKILKSETFPKLSREEQQLKIAVLTELAGLPSEQEYRSYLRLSSQVKKGNIVRAKLVRESKRPWGALRDFESELRRSPELMASVLVDVYAQKRDDKKFEAYYASFNRTQRQIVLSIGRQIQLEKIVRDLKQMRASKLESSTDNRLKRSLDARLKYFSQLNQSLRKASHQGDFTAQLIYSNFLIQENSRLSREIKGLPIPKGLKPAQRAEYAKLLSAQAQTFTKRADELNDQVSSLLKKSKYIESVLAAMKTQTLTQKRISATELNLIAQFLGNDRAADLREEIADNLKSVSRQEILAARAELRQDPFSVSKMNHLRDLELKAGQHTMAAYLETRMNQAQKGYL